MEQPVRISLVDLVYGAVIGIALERFDPGATWIDWLRWGFAVVVVSIDWIYVHRKYWEWDYKYNSVFFLDVVILFSMSRLFSPTSGLFWFWMGVIFACYCAWDIFARRFKLLGKKEFTYSFSGDLLAVGFFGAAHVLTATSIIVSRPAIDVLLMLVYGAAVVTWHVGAESQKRADESGPLILC